MSGDCHGQVLDIASRDRHARLVCRGRTLVPAVIGKLLQRFLFHREWMLAIALPVYVKRRRFSRMRMLYASAGHVSDGGVAFIWRGLKSRRAHRCALLFLA